MCGAAFQKTPISWSAFDKNPMPAHHFEVKAIPTRVINTTGAGDAFIAGVAHAQVMQTPFPDCAQTGLKAAHATLLSQQTVNPDINKFLT